jgi:hypothetical protein
MRKALLLASAVLGASLLLAATATASYDPVAGGTVRLTLDKGFTRLLAANGVRIETLDGFRRQGRSLLLPVVDGRMDPTLDKGEMETAGTLVFRHGRRRVKLRRIEVKAKREPLVAKVGGSQLKVASAGRLSFERDGFGSALSARPLRLTAKFATRLGKKLGLRDAFAEGQRLGTLRSQAQPTTLAVLPVGRASFVPAPEFLAKLDSRFVSLNPVAPAERAAGPVFTVPFIADGTIAPDAASGVPRTGGALEFLRLGSGQVFWQELWFDLAGRQVLAEADIEPTPTFPGKVGQVAIASIAGGAVAADPGRRTVTVSGAGLALSAAAADQFNLAFGDGEQEFRVGEPLGTLTFTAQTQ